MTVLGYAYKVLEILKGVFMTNQPDKKQFNCTIELTLDIIGGKWKPLILYHLTQYNILRYGEIKKLIPNINERMLTRQLRELEKDQLIHREVYREVPPRVEYSLTEMGDSLKPILLQLGKWGVNYNDTFDFADIVIH